MNMNRTVVRRVELVFVNIDFGMQLTNVLEIVHIPNFRSGYALISIPHENSINSALYANTTPSQV